MIRRPPRSPLYPYPTLFRSREPRAESREPRAESREPRAKSREPRAESREPSTTPDRRHAPTENPTARPLACEDRKSTRLNSSHANISYAVFCLKKNKIILLH